MQRNVMQYLVKMVAIFFMVVCIVRVQAQSDTLQVALSRHQLQPGDTLHISASYSVNGKAPKAATLFLNIVNENSGSWQLRWPLLDGVSETAILLPDSMTNGRYRLYFSALQAFFTVRGQVKQPEGLKVLKSVLLTGNGAFLERDVAVEEDGSFAYRNSLFPNMATLSFVKKTGKNDDLDISISTILDSVYLPVGKTKIEHLVIGDAAIFPADTAAMNRLDNDTALLGKSKSLPTVIVFGQRLSRARLFNERYSRGLFRDMNERIIDLLDDNTAAVGQTVLQFLGSRVAGLNVTSAGSFPTASWRGGVVQFYMDEMRVDIRQIELINVNDVAIIKTYPPPFTGNPGGDGGAVAVYTKRGDDDAAKGNRNTFRVRGYSPPWVSLSVKPDEY